MKFVSDSLTFKFFTKSDVDTLLTGHCEADFEGEVVNPVKIANDVSEYIRAAGGYSVKSNAPSSRPSSKLTGADGSHPDDLYPAKEKDGSPKLCPECKKPVGIYKGKAGPNAKNPGRTFYKFNHFGKTSCKWGDFIPDRDISLWKGLE